MPQPNLIHPIQVEVEQLNRDATIVDPDYQEPIQQGDRSVRKTCPGQIKWVGDERLEPSALGAQLESDGYVLFRLLDLRNRGMTIKVSDRFVSIGEGVAKVEIDVYVVKLVYQGHYPDMKGPTLVKAFFRDRDPAKQNRGGM